MSLTELARTLRKCATPTEKTMWHWLRHRYLVGYKFRRQHPMGRYILDFYCTELKLCIELDGRTHNTDHGAIHDEERTRRLSEMGVTVLRFWNDDVRKQPAGCWEAIVEVVEKLATTRKSIPSPRSRPHRERGEG